MGKVQAHVTRPVRIEGFIAEVEPGTQFEVEKAPISADIWLPTHFVMKSRAKILCFVDYNTEEDESYFDYHRPSSNGRVLPLNQCSLGRVGINSLNLKTLYRLTIFHGNVRVIAPHLYLWEGRSLS